NRRQVGDQRKAGAVAKMPAHPQRLLRVDVVAAAISGDPREPRHDRRVPQREQVTNQLEVAIALLPLPLAPVEGRAAEGVGGIGVRYRSLVRRTRLIVQRGKLSLPALPHGTRQIAGEIAEEEE